MFDLLKELGKPDPENERRRLNLIRKIKNNMAEEHARNELYYHYAVQDLNNFNRYFESFPENCPQKRELLNNNRKIYEIHNNSRASRNKLYYNMNSKLEDEIRNIVYYLNNECQTNRKTLAKKLIKQTVSLLFGFIPIIGNAKGIIDAIIGKDLITDEELSSLDRIYSGASSLPLIGDFISWENWVMKILEKLFKL